ncbi:MAG: bifunctional DNA primase/polymerase [Terriglobales bacterium]
MRPSGTEQQLKRLADRGWRLFPCQPKSKEPLIRWSKCATANIDQLMTWLHTFADCNWGIACGPASRLLVIDVDGYIGLESFAHLCGQAGVDWQEIADNTLGVKTGKGSQLYFTYPATNIRNSAGKLGPELDVRGDGGYVICPPSVHETGEPYHWLGGDENKPVAPAPGWLIEQIREKGDDMARTGRLTVGVATA